MVADAGLPEHASMPRKAITRMRLGERAAIGILRDHLRTTREDAAFGLTRFDGTRILVQ